MNNIDFTYSQHPSFQARMIKSVFRWMGMKKKTEKKMTGNGFAKNPSNPSWFFKQSYDVQESDFKGRKVWTISPKETKSNVVILYLHGGAYMANIIAQHWGLAAQLISKTNATMVVPDYPLAPETIFSEIYAFVEALYATILDEYSSKQFIFMGDSAGGGLALGLVQLLRNEGKQQPEQIILFSPWLDVSMSNPQLLSIEKDDTILSIKGLKSAGEKYAGIAGLNDFRVSPLLGNLEGLCRISVFTGTHDILNPDAKKLKALMNEQGLSINCFEYPQLFHDWVIITSLKESQDVIDKVYDLIYSRKQTIQ